MRMLIKKLLKKHKYPPEGMDDAVQTVMIQCELAGLIIITLRKIERFIHI